MIRKETIVRLVDEFIKDSANYLIDVQVSTSNKIRVYIENDEHVSIQDCIAISKHIESNLDREKEDFELEVSSPGIDQPFKKQRQYQKYQGKDVELLLNSGEKTQGKLLGLEDGVISIIPLLGKDKKKNKTIKIITDNQSISFPQDQVRETRLIIVF